MKYLSFVFGIVHLDDSIISKKSKEDSNQIGFQNHFTLNKFLNQEFLSLLLGEESSDQTLP